MKQPTVGNDQRKVADNAGIQEDGACRLIVQHVRVNTDKRTAAGGRRRVTVFLHLHRERAVENAETLHDGGARQHGSAGRVADARG
jgi:hypothetical protein